MLKIEVCCDVYDLIKEICAVTGKTNKEVAIALYDNGLHPYNTDNDFGVFITFKSGARCCPSVPWLDNAIYDILKMADTESITVRDNG